MPILPEALLEHRISLLREHGYELERLPAKQKSLRNRLVVKPNFDLGRFRITAKVDTVKLRATTKKSYRGGILNQVLSKTTNFTSLSVSARNAPADRFGREWLLKIQDPTPEQLTALERSEIWSRAPILDQVDVAIDFFLNRTSQGGASSEAARSRLLDLLARHVLIAPEYTNGAQNLRWFAYRPTREGGYKTTTRRPDDDHLGLIPAGCHLIFPSTTYVGRKNALEVRLYIKTRDRVGGKAEVALNPRKCSVRYEICIRGQALSKLGLSSISDLRAFDFQRLGRTSSFRLLTVPALPAEPSVGRVIKARIMQMAIEDFLSGGISHVAQFRRLLKERAAVGSANGRVGKTIAFIDLNKRINTALRRLTHRFRAANGA